MENAFNDLFLFIILNKVLIFTKKGRELIQLLNMYLKLN